MPGRLVSGESLETMTELVHLNRCLYDLTHPDHMDLTVLNYTCSSIARKLKHCQQHVHLAYHLCTLGLVVADYITDYYGCMETNLMYPDLVMYKRRHSFM